MPLVRVVNLEHDFPTVDEARRRLLAELEAARRDHVRVLKLIHGYGSHGTGGKLRIGILASLRLRKKEGAITCYVPGENWRVSDEIAWNILKSVPELKQDRDLGRNNLGITIVQL